MIKNDKQYQVTKSRLNDFKESLIALEQDKIDPLLKELYNNSLKSQIIEFEKLVADYELLKEGQVNFVIVDNLSNISEVLIKARIVKRLSQSDLAKSLDIKAQQIQRYEISDYSTASIGRIFEIANVLGIQFGACKIKLNEPHWKIPDGINEKKIMRIRTEKSLLTL